MLRSMFSAVSGLRSHQTMMDVTGNNVSNVNTTGYKASRATFQETLTQVVRGASSALGTPPTVGGVNAMQLGLGTRVAATDTNFSQGASQLTGRATDLAIQGDGFFIVSNTTGEFYTRAGAFSFDASGYLVTPNGDFVQGWMNPDPTDATWQPDGGTGTYPAQGNVQVDLSAYNDVAIGPDGTLTGRTDTGALETIGRLSLARFANANGLVRQGNSLYARSPNSDDGSAATFVVGEPGTAGLGTFQAGTLEMSNVDLAQEFTNLIMAQRGFQANSRTITASDEILQDLVNMKR